MPVGSGGSSGGASAGDVRAGGAFFEFFAKDSISKTIDQIDGRFKSFKSTLGGFTGAFAGGFLGGLGATGMVAIVERVGEGLANWVTQGEKFSKEMEKSAKLSSQIAQRLAEGQAREDARIAGLGDSERLAALREERDRLENERAGTSSQLVASRRALETLGLQPLGAIDTREGSLLRRGQRWIERQLISSEPFRQNLTETEAAHQRNMELAAAAQRRLDDFERESAQRRAARFSERSSREFFDGRGLNPIVSAIRGGLADKLKGISDRFFERSSKDFFSDRGLSPLVSALRPLVTNAETMWDLRQRTIEREFNLRGTGRTFGGLGALLAAGLGGLEKMGPQLELMRTASEIRTGSGGQNALQRFGVGQNVMELSLKAQQLIAKNTEPKNLANEVGAAVAGALVLR